MKSNRYTLERWSRKHVCPSCGKRRFVRYLDQETGSYLADHVGRCDREQSCGYHCPPRAYLADRAQLAPTFPAMLQPRHIRRDPQPPEKVSLIEPGLLHRSLKAYAQNHFVTWLLGFLPMAQVKALIERFAIGTSKHWPGATVFWQIDRAGHIRTGKVMLYDPQTGRRVKDPYPHQTWVHAILKQQGRIETFHLRQCLFGEWQLSSLPRGSKVAVVESEKTAILMTALRPAYTWTACGGLQMLSATVCASLRDFDTVCFPDVGGFEKWQAKADTLRKEGFQTYVSDLLEKQASDHSSGWDLADYFLPYLKGEALNQAEKKLALMAQANPHLLGLIERFSLTQTLEGQTVNLALLNRKETVNFSRQV